MGANWLIGVDIGGTTTKIAFISDNGRIVDKWEIPTDNENEGKWIPAQIAVQIDQKLAEHSIKRDFVTGIGVGAPGPADVEEGCIISTPNLAWPDYFPLQQLLEDETKLPVMINNDANCAALGEMWKGAGEGGKDLVCITLGTGVGGGIIVNGEMVQGIRGASGEIGHITSVPVGGALCNCGKRGCLETVSSATGIVRLALEYINNGKDLDQILTNFYRENSRLSAKDVFDFARNGDQAALSVVGEATHYLGLALANIANTLNPEKIVIGGGVSKAGSILLDSIKANFYPYLSPYAGAETELSLAKLGNDGGVIGAAWMIKNRKS